MPTYRDLNILGPGLVEEVYWLFTHKYNYKVWKILPHLRDCLGIWSHLRLILSFCAIILAPLVANAAFLFNTIPKENYTTITVQSLPAALSVEDSKVIQDE